MFFLRVLNTKVVSWCFHLFSGLFFGQTPENMRIMFKSRRRGFAFNLRFIVFQLVTFSKQILAIFHLFYHSPVSGSIPLEEKKKMKSWGIYRLFSIQLKKRFYFHWLSSPQKKFDHQMNVGKCRHRSLLIRKVFGAHITMRCVLAD